MFVWFIFRPPGWPCGCKLPTSCSSLLRQDQTEETQEEEETQGEEKEEALCRLTAPQCSLVDMHRRMNTHTHTHTGVHVEDDESGQRAGSCDAVGNIRIFRIYFT